MSYARPSLADLITRTKTDFEGRLGTQGPTLRRAFIAVCARVYAGLMYLLYGFLNWISLQIFPDTADVDQLLRHASFFGIQQKQASYATGNLIPATAVAGTIVPQGTQWQTPQNIVYQSTAAYTCIGTGDLIPVVATVAGATINGYASNLAALSALTILSPITGLSSNATVDSNGLSGGTDTETSAALLGRVLQRVQNPPLGGTAADYITWALSVSFVTRAWSYPNFLGPGTVGVAFVEDGNTTSIFPSAADVTTVQNYINALRPVTAAQLTVFAPTDFPVPMSIHIVPQTAATQAAVTAQLNDMFTRLASPGTVIPISQVLQAIEIATGVTDSTLVSPTANITPGATALPRLGTITWV